VPRGAQYATTDDGVRIAFMTAGQGEPLFWLPHFLASHVELEWEFPQRYIFATLSHRLQVVRLDTRGLGLSDRDVDDVSLEARMRDVTAVADRLGAQRFSLVGVQGGGNLAATYAATHPGRVSRLVLLNWAPNFREEADRARMQAMGVLMQRDWDLLTENVGGVSFGFNSPFAAGYGRLVRASATQEMALRYGYQILDEDCYPILPRITADTLVLHSERSSYASPDSARAASASIPRCRLRVFEGDLPDHIQRAVQTIADFIAPMEEPAAAEPAPQAASTLPKEAPLTDREIEVLQLVVRGLSNREMAAELVLSPRTVERHLENIYRKTGARNRVEVAAYAVGAGLISA
jgi:pimeloyl-ACP methyl ester carboxylesterase/DNA-binding CsgD family transcriptional regulator